MIVNLDFLLERYDVDEEVINELIEISPHLKLGKDEYDLHLADFLIIRQYRDKLTNLSQVNRLKVAQAVNYELKNELMEIEIGVLNGKYLNVEEICVELRSVLARFKSNFNGLPYRLALQMSSYNTKEKCLSLLTENIYECLDELKMSLLNDYDYEDIASNYDS